MSLASIPAKIDAVPQTWADTNQEYLRAEMHRLRLLFRRRIAWLRQEWRKDPLADSRGLVISDARADRLLEGDNEQTGIHRDEKDAQSAAVSGSLDELDAELGRCRKRLGEFADRPSLETLAQLFTLSRFERDLLLLCLATEEDPAFASLCAYAQDDVNARYPTLNLALDLLCDETEQRAAARKTLLPAAPLRRSRLLILADASPGMPESLRPLRIDERIADYLRGTDRLDENVARFFRVVPPSLMTPFHRQLVDGLLRWAEANATAYSWPVFNLTGPAGAGRHVVAHEFCNCVGLNLYALESRQMPLQDPVRMEGLRHLFGREALLSRIAVYIDLADIDPADRTLLAALRDWVERSGGVVFVASGERCPFQRQLMHIHVPKPDRATQRQLWVQSLQKQGQREVAGIDAIVQQFDLGIDAIPQAVTSAVANARRCSPEKPTLTAADLWEACRDQVSWRLGDLAKRLDPCYSWDDIVLPADVFLQLREIADQVSSRAQVYDKWGFGARLPRGRGISALFSGSSGTGKTMAADVLANHLRLDLYRIDLAGVVSKYIGETEKNLRNVFDAAEETGAILFFDEADSLFGKRSEVKDSHDRYANIEVNYLLQRMEEYRGLAILCTNRRSAIDRAFLRRLRFLVDFPFPDGEYRRLIWQKSFPSQSPVGALNFDSLSRLEISGGNIRNIALNAAFFAAGEGTGIEMRHVLRAARREYAKIDKLLTESEFGRKLGLI